MRVLELGVHDGFAASFVAKQLSDEVPDLRIDGMELHPEAAKVAQRRIRATGARGRVFADDVHRAPQRFEEGSYDAVVAYELIEHVPDPEGFLGICERMLRKDGRVYVSTPDGTFGDGNNPHHLRAYRAVDLADTLRRRGMLADMEVGVDGITAAAYTPGDRKGDVAIYTGPSWMPWSPMDIETKGLGGSETAAVRLADALSDLGYVVTVYGDCEGCCYRNTIFRHYTVFDPTLTRHAVISSRIPELVDRPLAARVRLLWGHDVDFGDRLTPARAEKFDRIMVLSAWHEQHVAGMYPFAADKLTRIRNGIEPSYFEAAA